MLRVVGAGLRMLSGTRQEMGRAMLAEAAALEPGPDRRAWLRGACWFLVKGIAPRWLRRIAIAGSALMILWTLYNGIDSGWKGTAPEIASYVGMITLLTLNIVLHAAFDREAR